MKVYPKKYFEAVVMTVSLLGAGLIAVFTILKAMLF